MQDLRSALDRLDTAGRLRRIQASVSPIHELASVSRYAQLDEQLGNDVLLFEQVEGTELRVLANLFHRRENVAISMGIEPKDLLDRGVEAVERPLEPELVNQAPCPAIVERPP